MISESRDGAAFPGRTRDADDDLGLIAFDEDVIKDAMGELTLMPPGADFEPLPDEDPKASQDASQISLDDFEDLP